PDAVTGWYTRSPNPPSSGTFTSPAIIMAGRRSTAGTTSHLARPIHAPTTRPIASTTTASAKYCDRPTETAWVSSSSTATPIARNSVPIVAQPSRDRCRTRRTDGNGAVVATPTPGGGGGGGAPGPRGGAAGRDPVSPRP